MTNKITLNFFIFLFPLFSFAQNELPFLGNLKYEMGVTDVWGYADGAGQEYALVGTVRGLSIVDVTEPTEPVELFFIEDVQNSWRDIKTWQHYVYVVNEESGGLLIADLSQLPDAIDTTHYTVDTLLRSAHNIWIDEHGFAYLAGFNNQSKSVPRDDRGALILDVGTNPWNPPFVNHYDADYAHDVFVRDNLMYTSEIYEGRFAIIDVTDKNNPIFLGSQRTPNVFTHNVWLSDDSQTAFTTDERGGAFVAAYDISDFTDIKALDRYQSSPNTETIPHNVHVLNDYLVISYYTDGVRVVDAHNPNALTEVAYYDTSPASGIGFSGCWGAYPFLPSGHILASDRQEGLFILGPAYERANYITGQLTDAHTGEPIAGVEISETTANLLPLTKRTNFLGNYTVGLPPNADENLQLRFFKYGYEETIIPFNRANAGETVTIDATLTPLANFPFTANITNAVTQEGIEDVNLVLTNLEQPYSANLKTNNIGQAIVHPFYDFDYSILAYQWGWLPFFEASRNINADNAEVDIALMPGYKDDFGDLDFDWIVVNEAGTNNGWEKAVPTADGLMDSLSCSPFADTPNDDNSQCFMTNNRIGGNVAENADFDGISTVLSPILDLSDYTHPYLQFDLWLCVEVGRTTADNADQLLVELYDVKTTTSWIVLDIAANINQNQRWETHQISLASLVDQQALTDSMQVRITAIAQSNQTIFEAGFDAFSIIDSALFSNVPTIPETNVELSAFPNPFTEHLSIIYTLQNAVLTPNQPVEVSIFDVTGKQLANYQSTQTTALFTWENTASPGMYLLKVGNADLGYQTRKVVKF